MIFEKMVLSRYRSKLLPRREADGIKHYFDRSDFSGLLCDEMSFLGDKGQRLMAYLYYKGEKRTDRLIMFDHGMGNGHASYMPEINVLCAHGYTVFTYDHTGTRASEGEGIGGFSQSLADLDGAVAFVREMPEYKSADISVIGHSWGGFSTMNIPSLHPDIKHAVAISGFISPRAIQDQVLGGLLKLYRKAVFECERQALSDYAHTDARETLKNTKTRVLIIHSRDDTVCRFENHFEKLERAVGDNDSITFMAVDGKKHKPHYTLDALAYEGEFVRKMREKLRKNELSTDEEKASFRALYDWRRMTAQDMDVWNTIFDFLDK